MRPDLAAFIEHARDKGLDPMTIRMLLQSAGWKEKDVAQALSAQALELPIPPPPDAGGAREAFLHLLVFAAFYTAAIALVLLSFTYIEMALPDPALAEAPSRHDVLSGIRRSLAAVIVAFPLYLWLSRFLLKESRQQPEKGASGVRRWLTYLTLFLAATTLMCDVIALVFRLLEGELSVRFLLKVVVVGVIAGATFVYYLMSLRQPAAGRALDRGFAGFAGLVVLGALVWGLLLAGSPAAERLRKFDERRLEDVQGIRSEIMVIVLGDTRFLQRGERRPERPLPRNLDEVVAQARVTRPDIRDPETGEPYGYEVVSDYGYRLCAIFNEPRDEGYDVAWNHPAGRHCFELDALSDLGLP